MARLTKKKEKKHKLPISEMKEGLVTTHLADIKKKILQASLCP